MVTGSRMKLARSSALHQRQRNCRYCNPNPSRYTVPQERETQDRPSTTPDLAATTRILARSFYRELRSRGYSARHVLALSSELIGLITNDLRRNGAEVSRAA